MRASVQRYSARLQLRQVENLVDEPQEPLAVPQHEIGLLARAGGQLTVTAVDEPAKGTEDECEWRAELVAQVREQPAANLIELGELGRLDGELRVLRLELLLIRAQCRRACVDERGELTFATAPRREPPP